MAFRKKHADGKEVHQLFMEVYMLSNTLTGLMDTVHEAAGFTTPQFRVAGLLYRSGPSTVPHLALALDVSRQFIQTVCNDLHQADLIEFQENPLHKRSKLVVLTDKGKQIYAKGKQKEAAIVENNLPDLDVDRIADASKLLADIRERILGGALVVK